MSNSNSTPKVVKNSQGGLMIWHGMRCSGLYRLFRSRPALHWSRLPRIASLPFSGMYNSVLARLEDLCYGRRVRETELTHPPLFVLGYWRSGTTFLQNLLSHDPQFQHLGLYRALFPWHFLLTENLVTRLTAPFVPKHRPMDNIAVHWDSPQEDDVALCIMSQISPIALLSHPHDHSHFWRPLDFNNLSSAELQRWKDSLDLLIRKLTFASSKRILMKSPFHTYHIPTLLEMYPDARFLYIHRNPYHVFRSTVHLRRRMIEENTLGRCVMDGTEEQIISTYKHGFDVYQRDKHLIPEGHLHEICYEHLEQDPIGELKAAYKGMTLEGFDQLEAALAPKVESLRRYKKNQFQDDPYWASRVYNELRDVFERHGYPEPDVSGRQRVEVHAPAHPSDAAKSA